jgi:glyoxylate/hydroxypyruvate reductase A
MPDSLHIHFDSRRSADPVFHLTRQLCEEALARAPDLAGKIHMTTSWDLEGIAETLQSADMLVGFRMPKEAIRTAPKLSNIHLIGAGVEHLRPMDWVPGSVTITNNRGIHRQKAAEFIVMALLVLNNRLQTLVRAQAERRWAPIFTTQAAGKTVLIVGAGELGSAGGRAAAALGLHVVGIRRSAQPQPGFAEMHGPDALHALLPRADFVVVTTPSTALTDGLFGPAEFDLMKPGAGFVNFGRARVCDYAALAERLRSGRLAGAVLDVFDPEPLPAESELWTLPNLIITPHCSSDDAEGYVPATLDLVFDNAARLLRGETLRNAVDTAREY